MVRALYIDQSRSAACHGVIITGDGAFGTIPSQWSWTCAVNEDMIIKFSQAP